MVCSVCGTENRPGRRFCGRCGAGLATTCPVCGSSNEADERFCGECGTALQGDAAVSLRASAATRRVPGGPPSPVLSAAVERRLVSVLFADLVGFTPFAEERDSEEVREVLTRWFDLAGEIVLRYGGTVEKFIGDAVMAVWGAPLAHEDDAERAVRAGLELIDAVQALGPRMAARAGVLTGEAAVTLGATNQGLVAGDLVNTASRLQSVAQPGTVLVGEATQRAAGRSIVFEPAGQQALKGKVAPVPAWRALRVVAERGGRNRAETLEAPFVGRDDELRLLKDLYHATAREGRSRLVSVVGPAGIGKTRLAWEFEKYLDGIVGEVWWHRGRSPAQGSGLTFWAVGEMVRGRCGLSESDDETTTRARVAATVAEHVPDPDDRRWIEPSLLALLGIESAVGSEQLFGAWRMFFERLAVSAPVVLVFEDLHWADSGTLDFIAHLLEWSRASALYVVTLARPELTERRPDWGLGVRNFTSLHLEPLPEAAMRLLLAGLVPGLPESTVRAIVARADGIPLYAVETVRMLVADGRLLPAGEGTYALGGDLSSLPVPETLTALITARLDALDPVERALLLDASVLGHSFTTPALAAVSGSGEADLEPHLRSLLRRELLVREIDPRSPERGQHAFVQALIREVAYATLARRDRAVRHLAAARFFESLGSDELAGLLAGHYLGAHANTPEGPERDALAVQARLALRGAAERAVALGAHDQAIAFLQQALAVATEPADEADLLERAGESASVSGRHEDAERLLGRAIELRQGLGERSAIVRACASLGRALLNAYRTEQAITFLEARTAEFADLGPVPPLIALEGQLARGYMLRGQFHRAVEVSDRVLDAAERADLVEIVADTLVTRGSALCSLGRGHEGRALLEAGERLAEAHGWHAVLFRALGNRAVDLEEDDPRAGLEVARTTIALERKVGRRSAQAIASVSLTALRAGEWTWVVGFLEATLAETPDRLLRVQLLCSLSSFRSKLGEPTSELLSELAGLVGGESEPYLVGALRWARYWEALSAARAAEARTESRALVALAAWAGLSERIDARACLWSGDIDSARADLATMEAAGGHGRASLAERLAIGAGIAALEGRPDDALAGYRRVLRAWRDLRLPWDEAITGLDMAVLLGPSFPEVRAAGERSREILVELAARPFIEQLDAALTSNALAGRGVAVAEEDPATA